MWCFQHHRSDIPVYILVSAAQPRVGSTKNKFIKQIKKEFRRQIKEEPMTSNDIEVEIVYSTTKTKGQRADIDNIVKPILDALEGIAYKKDDQVRSIKSTLFDRTIPNYTHKFSGRTEHLSDIFNKNPHNILIFIYSDVRLKELGGGDKVITERINKFIEKWRKEHPGKKIYVGYPQKRKGIE